MLKRVKTWLGIEGVKIQLEIDDAFDTSGNSISGTAMLTSQSEQHIATLHLSIKERYSRGRRSARLIDEYLLGEKTISVQKHIHPGEEIRIPFEMTYEYTPTPVEAFGSKNFLYRGLAALAKFSKNVRSEFFLTGELSVKGNALRPYHQVILAQK